MKIEITYKTKSGASERDTFEVMLTRAEEIVSISVDGKPMKYEAAESAPAAGKKRAKS
jgi:hypothetical protein